MSLVPPRSTTDTTTFPGPSEVNTRIYSPEHENLYSLRPLGQGEYRFSWEALLFTSESPGDIFYPILADLCYPFSHWLIMVTWVVFTLWKPQVILEVVG